MDRNQQRYLGEQCAIDSHAYPGTWVASEESPDSKGKDTFSCVLNFINSFQTKFSMGLGPASVLNLNLSRAVRVLYGASTVRTY